MRDIRFRFGFRGPEGAVQLLKTAAVTEELLYDNAFTLWTGLQKVWRLTAFSPALAKQNGGPAPSTRFFEMKNTSDALLQKTYTTDFLNKTRVKNNGIVPQYYVEGNHEAIIPKDIFLRVQEELVRRRVVKTSANGKKRSYSCNHCFAQIVICGECGEMFRRIHWNNRGCKSIVWRCISRLEPTGQECHARTVNETVLENVVVQAINTLLGDKSTYQAQLQQNIAKVIRSAQQNTADGINERLQRLQKELLKKTNSKEAYDEIADEIFKLREQHEKCTVAFVLWT